MRIALVVDANGRLMGTVTDGDVRRAILQHVALTEPVALIMNAAPKSVPAGTPRQDAVALMQAHSLLQVPILDPQARVVGIETLLEGQKPRLDNWVFLVAGGFGARLRPLTDTLPKPMLQVAGRPVLEIILDGFLACGFHRFCIAVHYRGDTIKRHFGDGTRWNATIRYVEEEAARHRRVARDVRRDRRAAGDRDERRSADVAQFPRPPALPREPARHRDRVRAAIRLSDPLWRGRNRGIGGAPDRGKAGAVVPRQRRDMSSAPR